MKAERVIGVYGMGLTQHTHGSVNVGMPVNLLMPVTHHDLLSKTPGSKSVPVRIEREEE